MANIRKNAQGYNYKYTDLAAVNDYIDSLGETYYQEVETTDGVDYIITIRQKDGGDNLRIRGCRIIDASLSGKNNAAQEAGSGITYARRYSLLMAYGLATEDDDAESYTTKARPSTDTKTSGGDQEILARAKAVINKELESHDYTRPDQKKAFIKRVLEKETIDSEADADLVMDSLENEN